MAIGKGFDCHIDRSKVEVSIGGKLVYKNESRIDFNEDEVRKLLSGELVDIIVELHVGNSCATAYGCDLTEGYIKENASYYSS